MTITPTQLAAIDKTACIDTLTALDEITRKADRDAAIGAVWQVNQTRYQAILDLLEAGTPDPLPPTQPSHVDPIVPAGMRVHFVDHFDGQSLDSTRWKAYDHSTYGDGNHEMAMLMARNVEVAGGQLAIAARKEKVGDRSYTSGFIGSRETSHWYPVFGRYELRGRIPHSQGLWPAFWLRHRNGSTGAAEVDVMEYFHSQVPGKTTATLHLVGYNGMRRNLAKASTFFETPTATPGWHTWTVDISQAASGVRFEFLIDGKPVLTFTDTEASAWNKADPQATWDMAINLAIGGDWTGEPDGTLGELPNLKRCAQSRGTFPGQCRTDGIRRIDWTDPATTTYEVDYVAVMVPS